MSVPSVTVSMNGKLTRLDIGDLTLWFSYRTCIGYHTPSSGLIASENVWSNTTGRHLNAFSEKTDRIPRDRFLAGLMAVTEDIGAHLVTRSGVYSDFARLAPVA